MNEQEQIWELRRRLRLLYVVAWNTALNLGGGVGVGDKAAERMGKNLCDAMRGPLPEWTSRTDNISIDFEEAMDGML